MWKKVLLALSIVLGIVAFVAIPFIVGWDLTIQAVGQAGWQCVVVMVAVASLTQIIPALGWTILMRGEGMKVSLLDAVKANFIAFPVTFITPSMYLGGEPLKVFYIASRYNLPKRRVLATVIVSKVQEFGALILMTIVCAVVAMWRLQVEGRYRILIIGGTAALLIPFVLLIAAFLGRFNLTVKIVNLLAMFPIARRRLVRWREKAQELELLIHAAFTKKWKTFLLAQGITLTSAAAIAVRPWIYFQFTPNPEILTVGNVAMIYLVTNLANSITILPGALGFFEGGMLGYFEAAKLGAERAAAFAIIARIADVMFVVSGIWLIVHLGLSRMAKGVARGEEKVSAADVSDAVKSEEEVAGSP
jgi:uncharacterized protein (TIRG00374 family)